MKQSKKYYFVFLLIGLLYSISTTSKDLDTLVIQGKLDGVNNETPVMLAGTGNYFKNIKLPLSGVFSIKITRDCSPMHVSFYLGGLSGDYMRTIWTDSLQVYISGDINEPLKWNITNTHEQQYVQDSLDILNDDTQKKYLLDNLNTFPCVLGAVKNWDNRIVKEGEVLPYLERITDEELKEYPYTKMLMNREKYVNSKIKEGENFIDAKVFSNTLEEVQLSKFQGKYILLDFTSTGCRPCVSAIPELNRLYEKFKHRNFVLISLWSDFTYDDWKTLRGNPSIRNKKENIQYISLWDRYNEAFHKYGIKGWPVYLLINPEGKIIYKKWGGTLKLEKALNKFLDE